MKNSDAPSGTAIEMAETMAKASGRLKEEIAFHSVRAGDIPSSHTVIFGAAGERMENHAPRIQLGMLRQRRLVMR